MLILCCAGDDVLGLQGWFYKMPFLIHIKCKYVLWEMTPVLLAAAHHVIYVIDFK